MRPTQRQDTNEIGGDQMNIGWQSELTCLIEQAYVDLMAQQRLSKLLEEGWKRGLEDPKMATRGGEADPTRRIAMEMDGVCSRVIKRQPSGGVRTVEVLQDESGVCRWGEE